MALFFLKKKFLFMGARLGLPSLVEDHVRLVTVVAM